MLRSSVLRMICDSRLRLVPAIEILSGSGQHRYELDVDVPLQQVEASRPEAVENRRLRVLVELFARSPILIEDKQVWIVIAHMEMVVHARGFGTRRLDEAMKHVLEGRVPFGA
jgi:hypothetical protein